MEGVAERIENCNVCMCILFPWIFPKHGGGFSEKWELHCLYVYIIPLITYFLDMERVAERNENCNVCMCILFPWSPISPTWMGCSRQWEFQCIYVYYSLDHLFSRHGGGSSQKWELKCLYVYIIPLITCFHKHGGGCSQKWELQCLYVYIIPLITYFHKHGGGCSQKWELQCLYVYIIPFINYFHNMDG